MLRSKSQCESLKIDILQSKDLHDIAERFCFPWTSSEATKAKWKTYFSEQKACDRIVCLARWQNQLIGYGSLLKESKYLSFRACGIPEIHDVWVSEEYRGHGFGKQLICHLERLAQKGNYQSIGVGVGLYKDYGRAQKLYVQLGYVPDGKGVTYQYQSTIPGNSYPLDDDFVLWMKKKLPMVSPKGDESPL